MFRNEMKFLFLTHWRAKAIIGATALRKVYKSQHTGAAAARGVQNNPCIEVLLDKVNQVAPSTTLVALVAMLTGGTQAALGGRPPVPGETMLRIHCLRLQQDLRHPAIEDKLHEQPLNCRCAGLDRAVGMLMGPQSCVRPRHLLEKH